MGVNHEVNLKISHNDDGQYWLGKTKPKTSFQIYLKHFQKVALKFKKKKNFLLSD